jgi:hypothetical protein
VRLTGTSWVAVAGTGSASFAQNDYVNGGKTEEVAQEVDAFQHGDAHAVMTKLWQDFGQCRTFSYTDSGMTIKTIIDRAESLATKVRSAAK